MVCTLPLFESTWKLSSPLPVRSRRVFGAGFYPANAAAMLIKNDRRAVGKDFHARAGGPGTAPGCWILGELHLHFWHGHQAWPAAKFGIGSKLAGRGAGITANHALPSASLASAR